MTDNCEPVAQAPEAQVAPAAAAAPAKSTTVWQVVAATALAAASGLGGFALGSHNDTIRPAGHMEQLGGAMPGGGMKGNMPGGPQAGGPMQGDGRGPGMGPHCEDASGAHAPVGADGSCPTGFTLDDKGRGNMPGVAPSTSPSATS